MKKEVKLAYKKIKPRPANVNFDKIHSARSLFAVKFAQIVTERTLIINIDESSINRHIKRDYSWIFKGQNKELKNAFYSGSVSIVMGIWSNGYWIGMLTNESIDTSKFIIFVENLIQWVKNNEYFGYWELLIILDNCAIHKSKYSIQKLNKIKGKIIFLPAYSPPLAPIEEFFGILKMNMRRMSTTELVNLNKKESYQVIIKALRRITPTTIMKFFKRLYSLIKEYII